MFSNLINAGSYIFNDDIFDWMPKGKHSIEREVFPKLAQEGLLSGQDFNGYFIDAGTPAAWNQGAKACIEHERFNHGTVHATSWYEQGNAPSSATVTDSMISKSCELGTGRIHQSSLLSGVHLGDGCILDACLIGKNARIGANCTLTGVVVDHGSTVPSGTVLNGGQWPPVES